ncbi:MAG: hypothetical protein QM635_02410, partial [Microbacteriaceae bacterium]
MTEPSGWAAPGGAAGHPSGGPTTGGWTPPSGERPGAGAAPDPGAGPTAGGWAPPPAPGLVPLRPLTLGDILGGSLRTMRRNPRATVGVALLLYLAVTLLAGGVVAAVVAWAIGRISMSSGQAQDDIVAGSVLGGALALLVPVGAGVVLSAILQGLVSLEVARATLGERLGALALLRLARGRIGALVGWSATLAGAVLAAVLCAVALVGLCLAVGGVIGIVVGVLLGLGAAAVLLAGYLWLGTRLSLVPSALVIERLPFGAAVARSWRLTAGAFWRTLGIELLVQLIVGTASQVLSIPIGIAYALTITLVDPQGDETVLIAVSAGFEVLSVGLSVVLGAIGAVLQAAVAALIYIDLRMRREGLDLELARFVEERSTGAAPAADPFAPPGTAPAG